MKKTIILVIVIAVSFLLFERSGSTKYNSEQNFRNVATVIPTLIRPSSAIPPDTTSIFVPYWALEQQDFDDNHYDSLYYFGVSATKDGIDTADGGYLNLERFNCPQSKRCILVLRMLDNTLNREILKEGELQNEIIKKTLAVASLYGFAGVALDLEMTTLSSNDTTIRINEFVQQFYKAAHEDYKTFSFIVYGDVYYRARPYDLNFIGHHCDEIMLMAYDFHKSYGEPGPNFSYENKESYGYDFRTMIEDVSSRVDKGSLAVIFGMYGYDWTMNGQGTPLKKAQALTLHQIEKLRSSEKDVAVTVNSSKEKELTYRDSEGLNHIVWYEDEESVSVKKEFLKSKGINRVSYWAWGYF